MQKGGFYFHTLLFHLNSSCRLDLEKIIRKCIKKNQKAQKELYDFLSSKLYAMCMRYANSSDEAQEYLQLGVIQIFQNLEKFNLGNPFIPWAKRVAVNEIFKTFRKKSILSESGDIEDHFEISGDTEATIEGQFTLQELKDLINKLPEKKKIVFNLYVIEGYNHNEIGELLGISPGTSKSQLAKAKSAIREEIEKLK